LAIIQHHDIRLAERIDALRVSGLMMRNLSFGFLLWAFIPFFYGVRDGFTLQRLFLIVVLLFISLVAVMRARSYFLWFYRDLFYEALNYGKSLDDMIKVSVIKTKGIHSK
jgi:hypothetical protein